MSELEYQRLARFISRCVNQYGRGLDQEESCAEAWRAVLEAKAFFRRVAGCGNLRTYMEHCIQESLGQMRQKRNRRIAMESSFSLDAPWYESGECFRDHLPRKTGDFSDSVEFWDFLGRLGGIKPRVARLLIHGLSDREVMEECRMSAADYYTIIGEFREDLLQWQSV